MRGIITPKGNKQVSFCVAKISLPSVDKCCAHWGIAKRREMNLKQEAADFYLLYDLSIDFPGFKLQVNEKAAYLATQFSGYMIMAIGGEVRHAKDGIKTARCPAKIWYEADQIKGEIAALIEKEMGAWGVLPRSSFWFAWRKLYKKHGLELLETAQSLFEDYKWSNSSYGGHSWGKICQVLLRWLRKEDNDIVFVDTCWGLHHNGDIVFDKLWSVENLQIILDYNANGKLKSLCKYASPTVKDLWIKYTAIKEEWEVAKGEETNGTKQRSHKTTAGETDERLRS